MDEIKRRGFADPELVAIESAAIELATNRTDAVLAAYARREDTFGGRYVAADTMKELMPLFAESAQSRSRFNGAVHNAAAVLSAEQYRRLIDAGPRDGRDKVVFVTGIPGAGKSSSIALYGQQSKVAAVFEGQMSRPGPSMDKIDHALKAGFSVTVVAVHVPPETALDRTHRRFMDPQNGRGASIAVMSEIQGDLPAGLQQVRDRFGDGVFLVVVDNTTKQQRHHGGWEALDILKQEGNREHIRERLSAALERGYRQGRFNDGFYRQAAGRNPEKSRERQVVNGIGSADRGRLQADGARSGVSAGDPEKDSLNLRKKPFHEVVAETLIEQLKAGTAPWQKPWNPGDPNAYLPMNPATGKRYRGINVLYLMAQGRSDSRWMTYRQAAAMGAQVRRGEKGTPVQYWKFREEQDLLDDKGRPVLDAQGKRVKETVILERPRVFFATVFNAEQIDGLPPLPPRNEQSWDAVERADNLLKASGARITHAAGNRAFYRPSSDSITLPERGQFASADRYYATALHELGHWTGHASRLDRDLAHPFGSEGYAREELRAEIASMILGAELGIGHDPGQHAAYVGSWIKVLRDDPLEVFRAAADAEKIHGYVMAFEQEQVQVEHREPMMHVNKQPETRMTSRDSGRQYIRVPFKENGEAKQLGARWDRKQQSWYVPAGMDMSPFGKWVQEPAVASATDLPVHDGRQYLAVPYEERSAAKSAGALWDKAAKSWYVGPHADMEKLERWRPENIKAGQGPSMSPREEFADAMRSLGFLVEGEHPVMDGNRHRMRVEGDKPGNASGFYVGHLDGHPAGYIKNNRTGEEMRWKSKGYVLDPVEKARLQSEAAAKLAERERSQRRAQEEAAQRVSREVSRLTPMTKPTTYLESKGVAIHDGALTDQDGKKTYIPAFDVHGKQWTMQYIAEDGSKRFAKNARKEGCFHPVGGMQALDRAPVIVVAEGYATAATLADTLGQATVAAFDSGNLLSVAKALHQKYPEKPIVIAGDDDRHLKLTLGVNPGREKAEAAAAAVGGKAWFPTFAPDESFYPANLQPVTPDAFRAHEQAKHRLDAASPAAKTLPMQEEERLRRSLLNPDQLEALAMMKRYTDFNDLAMKSKLGREGMERQGRAMMSSLSRRQELRQDKLVPVKEEKRVRVMRMG